MIVAMGRISPRGTGVVVLVASMAHAQRPRGDEGKFVEYRRVCFGVRVRRRRYTEKLHNNN